MIQPAGCPGWALTFADQFAAALDPAKWTVRDGWQLNGSTIDAGNVTAGGGRLALTLASATSGACVVSTYALPVGGFAEARVLFPGDGARLYNWPAWWASPWSALWRRSARAVIWSSDLRRSGPSST